MLKMIRSTGIKYTTVFSYDELNRLVKATRKFGNGDLNTQYSNISTQYTYDKAGNKVSEENTRGYKTIYTYDNMNRVESVTDALKNPFKYAYDMAGNKLSETNSKGDSMTYGYDKLNRIVTITDVYKKVVGRKVYDANSNVTKDIDAKGYLSGNDDNSRYGTVYTYDLARRLVTKATPEAAAKGKYTIKYEYNQYSEVVKQTDALDNATAYEYDAVGRLVKVTDALNISTKYSYDKLGSKLSMTDGRGKLTRYSYGAFGLLRTATNADSKVIKYKYDITGNVVCVIDKNGNNTIYTYDNIGAVTGKEGNLETGG